ncbi:MAG: GntR family transcriptional regulator [Leucobacter sp.]
MWLDQFEAEAVSSHHSGPLHLQLSTLLRDSIAEGSLPPGSQLPTEAELQTKFGVSRSVVRQAFASLTADGLIQRGRGRGSVVAPHREHHRQVQRMPGLSTQIASVSGPVSTEVLTLGPDENLRASEALGTDDLIAVRRRRAVGEEVIAVIHTWLPRALVDGVTAADLTDASLHDMLATRFGVPVSAGHRQVRAVPASEHLARELSLTAGTPLLVLEGTSLDDEGTPVEYFTTWHRADRVVFDIEALGSTAPVPSISATKVSAAKASATKLSTLAHASTASEPNRADVTARLQQLAAEMQSLTAML